MFAPSSLLLLPALGMRLGVESLDRRSESRCRVVRRGVDSARIAFAGIYGGAAGKHQRSEDRVWGSRVDGERRETAMACWSEAFSRVVSNHSPMNEETSGSDPTSIEGWTAAATTRNTVERRRNRECGSRVLDKRERLKVHYGRE